MPSYTPKTTGNYSNDHAIRVRDERKIYDAYFPSLGEILRNNKKHDVATFFCFFFCSHRYRNQLYSVPETGTVCTENNPESITKTGTRTQIEIFQFNRSIGSCTVLMYNRDIHHTFRVLFLTCSEYSRIYRETGNFHKTTLISVLFRRGKYSGVFELFTVILNVHFSFDSVLCYRYNCVGHVGMLDDFTRGSS